MKLESIDLVFNYEDENGKTVKINGSIAIDGWNQWGARKEELSQNVDLIERFSNEVHELREIE